MIARDESVQPVPVREPEADGDATERMPAHLARAMVQRLLEQQAQEIAVRSHEAKLRQLEVKAGYRFSRASLDAQERDQKDQRTEDRKKRRDQLFFVAFAILLLTALIIYLLQSGKDELAREILKALVYISMAATSGFFAGRSTERKKHEASEE
jgi:Flp pilus assembly protein TadB